MGAHGPLPPSPALQALTMLGETLASTNQHTRVSVWGRGGAWSCSQCNTPDRLKNPIKEEWVQCRLEPGPVRLSGPRVVQLRKAGVVDSGKLWSLSLPSSTRSCGPVSTAALGEQDVQD